MQQFQAWGSEIGGDGGGTTRPTSPSPDANAHRQHQSLRGIPISYRQMHVGTHIDYCRHSKSACSVAVSYKPPMLVTRVRIPACAFLNLTRCSSHKSAAIVRSARISHANEHPPVAHVLLCTPVSSVLLCTTRLITSPLAGRRPLQVLCECVGLHFFPTR